MAINQTFEGANMSELKKVLMERDGLTSEEADERIAEVKSLLEERLEEGEDCQDICEEEFGLEPDYLMDLLM